MKTCAYDEFYLPMAMENLGDALEYAVCELALEPDDFFQRFLSPAVWQTHSETEIPYLWQGFPERKWRGVYWREQEQ